MTWRVIARIGYTNDGIGSTMRNFIADHLKGAGFTNSKTGTWETSSISQDEASETLVQVLRACADPAGVPSIRPDVHLKHLWLYIDRVADDDGINDDDDADKAEMYG